MKIPRSSFLILAAWAFFVGGYVLGSLLIPPGRALSTFGDIFLCFIPLFANACLLWNAASPYRRRNAFWMLMAFGCTLWLAGQLVFVYEDLQAHSNFDGPFPGDILFFLHTVPFMAALALLPHARKMAETLRYGFLDLLLLSVIWLYIYIFVALPWKAIAPNLDLFHVRDLETYMLENLVVVFGFGILFFRTRGSWRVIYGNFFGAFSLYAAGYALLDRMLLAGKFHPGSIYDAPVAAAFVWIGTTGILARHLPLEPESTADLSRRDTQWPARLAMLGVLSLPVMAAWAVFAGEVPQSVRNFRLIVTLVGIFAGTALVFLRQYLVYQERTALVQELSDSLENVRRLQTHFVQSEKLASLGQLAAGAAHEINNPLTAILGYADVLTLEHEERTRPHMLGEKIREQARRTKELVNNLLSFARQVPAEKQLLDLNTVLAGAIQLRTLDLRDRNIRIEFEGRTILPAVRGDPNQLLQVFYHLISNAVDAMETIGGGVLLIRSLRERNVVVIEFSDTGPGMREPEKVFDPFYTTKPVGKGTGLGLSICYGVMQEHAGRIMGFNRPEGGCTFRLELPAVLAVFPLSAPPPSSVSSR